MSGKTVARLVLAASVMVSAIAWAATPSIDQVHQAAQAGNYAQAQSLMDQVLRDYPNSAKAHFAEAELLAKQSKLAAARGELDTAQRLDPSGSFAKPAAIQELKTLIAGNSIGTGGNRQARPINSGPASNGHLPWRGIVLVIVIFALGMMFLRRTFGRNAGGYGPVLMPGGGQVGPMGPAGPMGYGSGGGMMAPPMAGGMGSGIMGGLATGAAVGAGMVAGESLMHRVLDGGSHQSVIPDSTAFAQNDTASSYDMGGNDFGLNDAGSWDNGNAGSGDSWDSGGSGGNSDDWN